MLILPRRTSLSLVRLMMPANRKIPSQFEPQSHDGMSKFPYVPHVAKIVTFIYANIYQSNEIIRLEKFQHRPKPRGQRSQLPERTRGAYGFEMCGILCGFILSIFGYSNAHVLYMQYIYIYTCMIPPGTLVKRASSSNS